MKILFTGGGTGGHFYPIIAVAEEIQNIALERNLVTPSLYYVGPEPYDERILFEKGVEYKQSPAGKIRRYPSLKNFFDLFKTAIGLLKSLWILFFIYPDVVFSKGGYTTFPVTLAARILRIPVVVHESDAVAGRANIFAGKFATKIAIAYPDAAKYFPGKEVAYFGNPVRDAIKRPATEGAHEYLKLDKEVPTLLIMGGSQGSQAINEVVMRALPQLVLKYQVIHQTGEAHVEEIKITSSVILEKSEHKERYKAFGYLNDLALRMAVGASALIISRAGSGAIFEIAMWGKPAILIPIPDQVSRDQRKNAFSFARSGAAIVIEEHNLTPNVFIAEVNRLMDDETRRATMGEAAKKFAKPNAARAIAEGIVNVALGHER
ncbi:MAG: undecaprenyldiphospho-muramoylpentapeptide beta-N-acetylglucosaminyltransferase [Candidatus Paceibacterota bacterium]